MKVGFTSMVMIQKQSNNRHSGKAYNHQQQKRRGRSGVQQRACSLFFSTWRGLFTVSLFLLTLRWTLMFWDAWEKMCDVKDRKFGATTTGSFIMTMCPPTRPWKPQSLWLTTTWSSFPILPTRLWFCLVSQIENETEGMTFWNSVWHPKGMASGTQQH
jgi:hypothetical protein